MSNIKANIIKDSISDSGQRLTTFELEYHRMIHGEFMTHRTVGKNSSSSRAVPLQKAIQNIRDNPAFPVHWGKAQNGMVASQEISPEDQIKAKLLWQKGIDQSIALVEEFDKLGVHKQIAARWLETGQMIKVVATATDWDNLLWLRKDVDAQPEFNVLATLIKNAFDESTPQKLKPGEWHLPYITSYFTSDGILIYLDSDNNIIELEEALMISTSCSAQVSFRRMNDSKEKALEIYQKLFSGSKKHMSPTEHQGTPIPALSLKHLVDPSVWPVGVTHMDRDKGLHSGNLSGWIQYRQTLRENVYKNCRISSPSVNK